MQVFELSLQICFTDWQPYEEASERIGSFLDAALGKTERYRKFHINRVFKLYTFDLPYPLESGHIYEEGKIYTVRIRTILEELAVYFACRLPGSEAAGIQGLSAELGIIPYYLLDRVYTLTPVIMKTGQGYWRGGLLPREYLERLENNLIKKYNFTCNTRLSEDFALFQGLEFRNRKPVRVPYKNVVLLGDKLSLTISKDERAQELAYMALGTGIGENNARGCGFLSYRYSRL